MRKTILYTVLILSLLVFLSWYFSAILLYLVISMIIATLLRPLVNYLNNTQVYNINIPRSVAILVSFSVFILVLLWFISFFLPMLKDQLEVISGINFNNIWNWLAGPIAGIEKWLIDHGLSHNPQGTMMIKIRDGMASFFEFQETWEFGTIMRRIFSVAGSLFIGIISVVFMTFFFLFEKGLIRKFILALVPNAYFEFIITVFLKIEKLLTNYLIGLVFQCLAIFTLSALGLSILGLKYAITIAVFAAVANLVPYLGPLAGGMFAIIIAISTNHFEDAESYSILLMKVILVFSLVKFNDDMIVQPVIFSKSVRAHPLEIFIVIFAGATLAGIVGMIAAIPVYTIIRVSALELTKGFREYHIFKLKN